MDKGTARIAQILMRHVESPAVATALFGSAQVDSSDGIQLAAPLDELPPHIAKNGGVGLAVTEARNTRCPQRLDRLARDSRLSVKRRVAENPHTDAATIDYLLDWATAKGERGTVVNVLLCRPPSEVAAHLVAKLPTWERRKPGPTPHGEANNGLISGVSAPVAERLAAGATFEELLAVAETVDQIVNADARESWRSSLTKHLLRADRSDAAPAAFLTAAGWLFDQAVARASYGALNTGYASGGMVVRQSTIDVWLLLANDHEHPWIHGDLDEDGARAILAARPQRPRLLAHALRGTWDVPTGLLDHPVEMLATGRCNASEGPDLLDALLQSGSEDPQDWIRADQLTDRQVDRLVDYVVRDEVTPAAALVALRHLAHRVDDGQFAALFDKCDLADALLAWLRDAGDDFGRPGTASHRLTADLLLPAVDRFITRHDEVMKGASVSSRQWTESQRRADSNFPLVVDALVSARPRQPDLVDAAVDKFGSKIAIGRTSTAVNEYAAARALDVLGPNGGAFTQLAVIAGSRDDLTLGEMIAMVAAVEGIVRIPDLRPEGQDDPAPAAEPKPETQLAIAPVERGVQQMLFT